MDARIFPNGPDVRGPHHMILGRLAPKVEAPVFLRMMRESRGLTRAELATRSSVSARTLGAIETRESPLGSLATTAALADTLGIGRVVLALMILKDYESRRGGWS
ncbi:helix-turn-helix domain-containing protein [Amycolatopsis sp. NPDC059657]|uniref:helix-turn-helix domain-containing protein n=1 Tax=Amycolatopsis sp. NPDC059657 TaxID=3346899 RepID=UPI003671EE2F